ncbi:MAG: low molecular weight phosphotyrosine protein phosphatase [Streptosporangiales bacterium]|nr:low molecular weight phosphotyrosine protein phosphatase [Streptosporangiales bacterium]
MSLPPPLRPEGPYHVCFVCLGNICRSPVAEVVARAQIDKAGLAARVTVDSAGTGDWHVGHRMNSGSRAVLASGGYDGDAHLARQFDRSWDPDLVLAMDKSNLKNLRALYRADPGGQRDGSRVRLFGEVAGLGDAEVPDPYGGGPGDFAEVLRMVESAMPSLVSQLAAVATQPRE